jgi:hypothetical protein
MTFTQIANKYKITKPIAVGLLSHLRILEDSEITEEKFCRGYKEFTGKEISLTTVTSKADLVENEPTKNILKTNANAPTEESEQSKDFSSIGVTSNKPKEKK